MNAVPREDHIVRLRDSVPAAMLQNDLAPLLRRLILCQLAVEVKEADVHRCDGVHRPLPLGKLQLRDVDVSFREVRAGLQPLEGTEDIIPTAPLMFPPSVPVR